MWLMWEEERKEERRQADMTPVGHRLWLLLNPETLVHLVCGEEKSEASWFCTETGG